MRTRWQVDALHRWVSRLAPPRLASWRPLDERAIAGAGVDVATGHVTFTEEDLALDGPPRFALSRTYVSGNADRAGLLGRGWSLAIEQSITEENGGYLWRDGQGRELWFAPDATSRPGQRIAHPFDRARLTPLGQGLFRIDDGPRRLRFEAPSAGQTAWLSAIEVGRASTHVRWTDAGVTVAAGPVELLLDVSHGRLVRTRVRLPSEETFDFGQYGYSDTGDLVRIALPHDVRREYEYAHGLVVSRRAADGDVIYYGYDGGGVDARCVRTWRASGCDDRKLDYRAGATTVVDGAGTTHYFEHDALRRLTSAAGATFRYHPERLVPVERATRSGRASAEVDGLGRPIALTHPDGAIERLTYDEAGRVVGHVDGVGARTALRFDDEGELVERGGEGASVLVRTGDGGQLEIVHGDEWLEVQRDRLRRPVEVRLKGEVWRASYDALGRPAALEGPEGRRTFEHDAFGRVAAMSVDGVRASFRRDGEGRLVQATLPDGDWVIERQPSGLPGTVTRPDFSCQLRFDAERRLTDVIDRRGRRWAFTRDRAGRIVEEVDFDHRVYGFAYAGASRDVTSVILPNGERVHVRRDRAGRIVAARYGSELEESFEYDAAGRLIIARSGDDQVRLTRDKSGRVVSEQQGPHEVGGVYDPRGRRSLVVSSLGARITRGWGADGARLLEVIAPDGARHEVALHKDKLIAGMLSVARAPSRPPLRDTAEGEIERDDIGRISAWTAPDGRRWTYQYGADGLVRGAGLPSGETIAFSYDAFGRRTAADSPRYGARWVWDGGVGLHELSSDAPPRTYVFDPADGSPVGRLEPSVVRWLGMYEDFVCLFDPDAPSRPTSEYWPWRGGLYIDFLTGLWLGPGRTFHPRAAEPMGTGTLSDELFGPVDALGFDYAPRILRTLARADERTLERFVERLTTPAWLELPRTPPTPWPEPIEAPSLIPRGLRI
ncbi:MAG: DUF6531 domain-containing protein [Sandaracinaceae bacterium]